jgi:proteasome lid subunit RPN8/RPN11
MSGDATRPLAIDDAWWSAMFDDARRAFPDECCGWLTARGGVRRCANAQAGGAHPTAPDRDAETAYVIDGDDLIAFARAFDGDDPPLAIYHSHPNGRAYFSATDRAVARSPWGDGPAYPVQQIVIGIDATRVTEAALFAWSDDAGDFVELARYPGPPR